MRSLAEASLSLRAVQVSNIIPENVARREEAIGELSPAHLPGTGAGSSTGHTSTDGSPYLTGSPRVSVYSHAIAAAYVVGAGKRKQDSLCICIDVHAASVRCMSSASPVLHVARRLVTAKPRTRKGQEVTGALRQPCASAQARASHVNARLLGVRHLRDAWVASLACVLLR